MADNDNEIQPLSGELLPATSKLSEITKDLMIANSSFERSVTRIEKSAATDLSVELSDPFETIFRSMESSLKEITKNIKVLAASIAGTFFEINQNHLQSITVQKEVVAVADEQLGLDEEKFEYQKNKDNVEAIDKKSDEQKAQELARESAGTKKGFGATFAKDLEDAEKEFQEKGFTKYIADLMGFGGTIQSVLKTISTIAPIFTVLGKSMLGFLPSVENIMKAVDFVKTGLIDIGKSLMSFGTRTWGMVLKAVEFVKTAYLALQARIITGLSSIGKALMSFVRNPIGHIVKAISFLGTAFTALGASIMTGITAIGTGLATVGTAVMTGITAIGTGLAAAGTAVMTFISGVLLPGITAIVTALAPLLAPAALIVGGLIAAYQFFEGFLDGFTENAGDSFLTKTIKGLTRGIGQIVDLFVAWPLDLMKDLVSWVADALGFEEFSAMLDSFSFSDFFTEIFANIENFFVSLGDKISSFFSDLFDFSKIQDMLTNLFAEIGIPRIEFDLPVVGKVGFGPFYPFMPDANTSNISAGESVDTVSTTSSDGVDTRKRTSESMITAIEGEQTEGRYARGARSTFLAEESIDASSGEEITTNKNKNVLGEFNTETGEGFIKYQARDANNELNNIMQEFNVSGITFGQVRRLIADGASPDEVRMFLENKNKSIFDKIGDFFSSPAETTPIQVAPADAKRTDIAQELGTQTAAREEARADQQSQQSVNVVNAPTSNVSNISQSAAYFDTPSAVDGLSLSY
jgi:hypothetical protein